MPKNEDILSEIDDKQGGVFLGVWDQEKTPALIEDLEKSVNLIEIKCKQLVHQLNYYKKYLNELNCPKFDKFLLPYKGSQVQNHKKYWVTGSDLDITFRKNNLEFQDLEEIFKENFQEKLFRINKKLSEAADKIGLKENIFLFSANNSLKTLNKATAEQVENYWSKIKEEFIKINCEAKSEAAIVDCNSEYSKITQNELKLYQQLSNLRLHKNKCKRTIKKRSPPVSKRVNLKFRFRKKRKKNFCEKYVSSDEYSFKKRSGNVQPRQKINKIVNMGDSKSHRKKKTKKCDSLHSRSSKKMNCQSHESQKSFEILSARKKLENEELELIMLCNSLAEAIGKSKTNFKEKENKMPGDISSLALLAQKIIPFTTCKSISKSFNIGMNIQQFLHKAKYAKNNTRKLMSRSVGAIPENNIAQTSDNDRQPCNSWTYNIQNVMTSYPWNQTRSISSFENQKVNKMNGQEKRWIAKDLNLANYRKFRSKYTQSSSQRIVEYHKSTTRQYSNLEKSIIKSESKRAYTVGSNFMVSDCRRTDFFEIDRNFFSNNSGDRCDERCTKLKIEWTKVYTAFEYLCKKYAILKEQFAKGNLSPSKIDLETLRNEIDNAIEKYKDFLKFYNKFLHLKHRLKSLKTSCETKMFVPITSFSSNCQKRLDSGKLSSIAMKKTLRHVQTLQERLKLIDDF